MYFIIAVKALSNAALKSETYVKPESRNLKYVIYFLVKFIYELKIIHSSPQPNKQSQQNS